jgi:hypothetical protein
MNARYPPAPATASCAEHHRSADPPSSPGDALADGRVELAIGATRSIPVGGRYAFRDMGMLSWDVKHFLENDQFDVGKMAIEIHDHLAHPRGFHDIVGRVELAIGATRSIPVGGRYAFRDMGMLSWDCVVAIPSRGPPPSSGYPAATLSFWAMNARYPPAPATASCGSAER